MDGVFKLVLGRDEPAVTHSAFECRTLELWSDAFVGSGSIGDIVEESGLVHRLLNENEARGCVDRA